MANQKRLTIRQPMLFILPPLLVYFFASFLFEWSVDPANLIIPKILKVLKAEAAADLKYTLIELKARYVWLASALLNIVIPITAIIYSIATIRSYVKGSRLVWTVIIGSLLCIGNLSYLLYSAKIENALYDLIYGFTYEMLTQSTLFSEVFLWRVYAIISSINILAAITPMFLLLAISGTLGPVPRHEDPFHLALRLQRLKEIINVASVFLVFGMLHMNMWLSWSASLVREQGLKSEVSNVAWSISAYWGVAFTLVLAVTYVPTTIYLQNRAREHLCEGELSMGIKEAEQWLNDHGFSFTLNNQIFQCISILAPFLAVPVGSALKLL
jgi:hypothetical protein